LSIVVSSSGRVYFNFASPGWVLFSIQMTNATVDISIHGKPPLYRGGLSVADDYFLDVIWYSVRFHFFEYCDRSKEYRALVKCPQFFNENTFKTFLTSILTMIRQT
jgi:hypothetical protein